MRKHGKAPKFVLVKRHGRWINGERRHVGSFFRGLTRPLSNCGSRLQLEFGF